MSQTNAQLLADSLGTASTGTVPIGGIILWSGSVAQINNLPGWALCNGSNGTPNLIDRFVVGASNSTGDNTYPGLSPNATGGSADAIVVNHAHNVSSTGRLSLNDPGHDHSGVINDSATAGDGPDAPNDADYTRLTLPNTTGITISGGTEFEGVSGTNANLPPYYALAYIMRTS